MPPPDHDPGSLLGCWVLLICALAWAVGVIALMFWMIRGFSGTRPPIVIMVAFLLATVLQATWSALDGGGRHRWYERRDARRTRLTVEELARRLDMAPAELRAFRPRYREIRIPKRSGGLRRLQVPDDATKALQRRILRRLLAAIPVHPAAYGFERGRSIAMNAAQHTGRAVVMRFDVVDFFPTTHAGRVERFYARCAWDTEAVELLTRLTTHNGGLPQGAPTSPRLSNLVNSALDRDLTRRVARRHGRYTRYADDITISFPEDWHGATQSARYAVQRELARRGYRMHVRKKLSVRRQHQRQVVTGLVVNERVALPRHVRRRLRAVRHHLATGRPATMTREQLAGWDALAQMVARHGAETPPPFTRSRGTDSR